MTETMRAGQFVEVGRMEVVEAPIIEPAEGDLLVRSHSASICGSDLHTVFDAWDLSQPFPFPPGFPGHEGIGHVVQSRHPNFAEGDAVLCAPVAAVGTCFGEYQTIPGATCVKLPESELPLSELLMAQQLGTVIFALRQHPPDVIGKNVVVMGQGSAGLFFTWLMRRAGAGKIIVADKSDARLQQSLAYGADHIINVEQDDVQDAVKDLTGGRGAEYLVEAVGRRDSFLQSVNLVGNDAEIMWFGLPDSPEPIQIDFTKFFRKRLKAASTYGAQNEADLASFQTAVDYIARGDIDVSPLLSHLLPLEKIQEAILMAHERTDNCLKVSIDLA